MLRWLGVLATVLLLGMVAASFLLWSSLLRKEQDQQRRELDAVTQGMAARIQGGLQERMTALTRMANRWDAAGGTPRHIWEVDAAASIRDMPGLLSLQWLDASGQVRWVAPLAGNERLVGAYPNRDPVRLRALETARAEKHAVLSAPLSLIQGGTGVLIFQPLQAHGRFDGFLVSVIRLDPLMRSILMPESTAWAFAVQYGASTVYGVRPTGEHVSRAALAVGDGGWTLISSQRPVAWWRAPLSAYVLSAGLAGALLVAGVLWLWRIALLRAEESSRLAHIVARTSNAVILTDVEGRVDWVNEGFTRITGYTLGEVKGEKPGDVLQGAGTDAATVARMHAHLLRGEGFREEVLNYHKNGTCFWLDIEVQPLRSDKGELTGFMAIESDITERKRAELALHETRTFLETVIDSLPVMLFVKDAKDLRFVTFNRAGEELLGLSRGQLLGKSDYDLFPREQADFFVERDREVLAQGKRLEIPEEPIDTPDGLRLLHTIKVPINDAEGRPAYLLGISTDITERNKIERIKSEFISTVSHELRTPLTAIRGSLGLVSGGAAGALPDKAKELLDIAYKNSERLTALINDLLDVEKIESGRLRFELARHGVASLVEQAITANQAYAAMLGVHVQVSGALPEAEVNVDAGRFLQVMANLLSNAAKFSPPSGKVEVSVVAGTHAVRVSVSDQGEGIPSSFRDRIFQKFSQADSSDTRAKGGTGLGLAITKSLVERMGGHIGFESRGGGGTTFFFELPLAGAALADR